MNTQIENTIPGTMVTARKTVANTEGTNLIRSLLYRSYL